MSQSVLSIARLLHMGTDGAFLMGTPRLLLLGSSVPLLAKTGWHKAPPSSVWKVVGAKKKKPAIKINTSLQP